MYKKKREQRKEIVKNQNKYINYLIIKTIIIITIILWESFPARVVCVVGVCVSGGEQELVKIFTDRQMMASWQVLEAVSEAERCWGFFFAENNGGVGGRWQHLTIHIENVIISVTMITKMLLVTRARNLRCTAFCPCPL